jgi:hypothetical protein
MTALVTRRVRQLADTLTELKIKVRAAVATELAAAVGNAIRDVLVVTLLDRLAAGSRSTPSTTRSRDWRDEEYDRERDRWGEPRDPWADDYDRDREPIRYDLDEPEDEQPAPTVPAAAAVAVGVNVGRWWLLKNGSLAAALGVGLVATTLGLVGGPAARAILTVLTAATDVLTAESILARPDA